MARVRNKRGSPEAIEKRKVGRLFNEHLGSGGRKLDGRTRRRRMRLLSELRTGAMETRKLKAIEVLLRVRELLEIGEGMRSIRQVCKVPAPMPPTRESIALVKRLHQSYGFPRKAYRFVGIGEDVLAQAGID